jgi:type IV secretion system protein VirB10
MYGPKLAEPVLPIDLAEVGQATSAPTGDDAPAQAVTLHNRSMLVPQGSMIPAVIESSIDSTEPGPVRAVTSGDTRGFDGTRILIPRGSRLVGDLHAGSGADQDRATVVWTRLVRPDGIAIRFSAPSTDFEGGVGVKGKVNNHILARVGAAVLQTGLTVGTLMAAAQSSNGSIILGLPVESASGVAQTAIPPPPSAPTITVRAGTPIMIFVNRDLDFTGALPKR